MEQSIYKLRLHFFYCTVILVLTIIAIAADRWTLQPKFTEYLGNAATMTSLVLGLVAIFYSYISNDGLSKSLGSLGSVTESISAVRDQVVRQIDHGTETAKEVHASAKLIEKTSISLEDSLSSLQVSLAEISSKTQELHGALGDLPGKIDALDAKIVNSAKEPASTAASLHSDIISPVPYTKDNIMLFLAKTSFESNLLALACVFAKRKEKPLVISEMRECLPHSTNDMWLKGVLQCMNAVDLIQLKEPFELETAEVKWINPLLDQETLEYINFYVNQFREENSATATATATYERLQAAVERVKSMFE